MTLKQLKAKLKLLGVTQKEASNICGVSQQHFSFFINGLRKSKSLQSKMEAYIKSLEAHLNKNKKGDL